MARALQRVSLKAEMFTHSILQIMILISMYTAHCVDVELEHLFDLYDADHSGTIDVLEVANILKAAGLHFKTGDVQNVFREMDIDGECSNSYITLAVKIRTFMKKQTMTTPVHVLQQY